MSTNTNAEPKRYRLLARAQMDGEVREPGYVFTLAEGERGPHKTMVASNDRGMALTTPDEYTPMMRDEPLYEEIKEE
jgi:hypothetical protein